MFYRIKYRFSLLYKKIRESFVRRVYFSVPSVSLNNVLVIKNDAIGDYIISRNFFSELKKQPEFSACKFYLACSPKLKPVVEQVDPDFFEAIFTIDFQTGSPEAMSFYKSLGHYKFRYLLHPTFSPDPRAHSMVQFSNAPHRIGFNGDTSNCSLTDKLFFEKFYTRLIHMKEQKGHEFFKQKTFFSELAGMEFPFIRPSLESKITNEMPVDVVLCPGAQHSVRIWDLNNYARLLSALAETFPGLKFRIVTGPGEDHLNDTIKGLVPFPVESVKQPSFTSLISNLASAQFIICNDSAPAHLAVALGVKSVCISNGNHYGRFVPYPEICHAGQTTVIPPSVTSTIATGQNPYYSGSTVNINTIIFEEVFVACKAQLS